MWLFALFLLVPLVEIALFITVGGWLTLWPTLGIVVLTGLLGAFLVRWQGMGVLRDIQRVGVTGDPISPLAHGALILIGGFMLMLPGFFTDSIGFLLMVPPLRRALISILANRLRDGRIHVRGFVKPQRRQDSSEDWVDAEFEEIVPNPEKLGTPSKRTNH